MKRIHQTLSVFSPAIFVILMLFGWIVVSQFDNFYLSSLYPFYAAFGLGGVSVIKYRNRDLDSLSPTELSGELILTSIMALILLVSVAVMYFIFAVTFELLIIFIIMDITCFAQIIFLCEKLINQRH